MSEKSIRRRLGVIHSDSGVIRPAALQAKRIEDEVNFYFAAGGKADQLPDQPFPLIFQILGFMTSQIVYPVEKVVSIYQVTSHADYRAYSSGLTARLKKDLLRYPTN